MRARLGWALLLLAAVFAMHGLQCTAAEPAVADPVVHGAVVMDMAATDMTAEHMTVMDIEAGHAAGSGAPAGHSSAAHALMVCLAVLAGGIGLALAALAAWLARGRTRSATRRATTAARAVLDRHRPALPAPELARLCVLRI